MIANSAKTPFKWYHRLSPKRHLGARLLIWFFVVSIVPLAIIGIVGTQLSSRTGNEVAIRMVTSSFHQQASLVNNYFRRVKDNARIFAGEVEVVSFLQTLNTSFSRTNPQVFAHSFEYQSLVAKQEPFFSRLKGLTNFSDILLLDVHGSSISLW